jgi:PAS domain S-box-containing protein
LAVDKRRRPAQAAGAWPFARSEMAERIRAYEWTSTPLGPLEHWPSSLRTLVDLMLQSPRMMAVCWGPQALLLFNDAFYRLVGPRGALALGRSAFDTCAGARAVFEPHLRAALAGRTVQLYDQHYPFAHSTELREAWFDETHHPVYLDDGCVGGVFSILEDSTARVQAERDRVQSEALLHQSTVRDAYLLRLSDALRPLDDAVAVMAEASRVLGEQLGAARVLYGEVSTDGTELIVERCHVAGDAPTLAGRYRMADFGPSLMRELAAGRSVTVDEVATAPGLCAEERRAYAALGIAALAGVPLIKGERFVANFSVHHAAPHAWTTAELALIEETAQRTWAAVELARAEAARRDSEAQIRAIANLVPDLLWRSNMQGDVQWYSERWYEYTGQAPGAAMGHGWCDVVHPQDLADTLRHWKEAANARQPYVREHRLRRHDGEFRWFLTRAEPLRDHDGEVLLWFGSATDVHEQRLSRELLEQRVAERTRTLQQLLLRLETVQDEERRRLARELHDGLGQYLSSVALVVGALCQAPDDPAVRGKLQRLNEMMQGLDRELDRMVFILRPTALEDGGLGEGVAAYARTWSELTGVTVDLELHGLDGRRLPAPVETAVFRIVQEALTNVAKYARASRVSVSLERRRRQLVGSVEDDGVGFDAGAEAMASASGRHHWGLLGMRERAQALGGSFAVESQPGSGTTVLWRLPLGH